MRIRLLLRESFRFREAYSHQILLRLLERRMRLMIRRTLSLHQKVYSIFPIRPLPELVVFFLIQVEEPLCLAVLQALSSSQQPRQQQVLHQSSQVEASSEVWEMLLHPQGLFLEAALFSHKLGLKAASSALEADHYSVTRRLYSVDRMHSRGQLRKLKEMKMMRMERVTMSLNKQMMSLLLLLAMTRLRDSFQGSLTNPLSSIL